MTHHQTLMNEEDLVMGVDDAHLMSLELTTHILEYANSYRLLSSQEDYLGKERLRYLTLLVMFDEMAKLMEVMKDCERAVTHKDPIVVVPGFYGKERSEKALGNIMTELSKSEAMFLLFKRVMGHPPSNLDFDSFKKEFSQGTKGLDSQIHTLLFYDVKGRTDHLGQVPEPKVMDMFFDAVIINAESAREFIYEWARAKELDIDFKLKAFKAEGCGNAKLWAKVPMPKSQRNL
jgi:hypothetical protein